MSAASSNPAALSAHEHKTSLQLLVLGALGVVYGDIGTSPLYAFKELFAGNHPIPLTEANVFGGLSMIFWALMIIVSLKYIVFILRADNRGEGGMMALIALALHEAQDKPKRAKWIMLAGILGTAMFYGDGMITPAISVLSAVEGLQVVAPQFTNVVIPITLIILVGLFMFQKHGTAKVGAFFGPVMGVWFGVLGVMGVYNVIENPHVLLALNPMYALHLLFDNPHMAVFAMGNVVLAVTGAEALYADMGHFGRKPIRLMLHFCGEVRLTQWYRRAGEWHTEPVIKKIYDLLSRDEARHGGAYLKYMKKALDTYGNAAAQAFAKIGVLMASSARTQQALHPTNLHVNKSLYPQDTVQSRIPDPEWLEHWLDTQIKFDKSCEERVVGGILRNLSSLFDKTFETVQDLNRFRKTLATA